MINYKPFFLTLEKLKISQYKLINQYFVSASTLSRLKHNKSVSLSTIDYLCHILHCDIKDIVTIY